MNCFDCAINERPPAPAVGICIYCGAAVCADCARLEERPIRQPATVGNPLRDHTRAVFCVSCDAVLDRHHGTALGRISVTS